MNREEWIIKNRIFEKIDGYVKASPFMSIVRDAYNAGFEAGERSGYDEGVRDEKINQALK